MQKVMTTTKSGYNYFTINCFLIHFDAGIPKREVIKKAEGDPVKTENVL